MAADYLTLKDFFSGRIERQGECWVYTGSRSSEGYGSVRHHGRLRPAHRVGYETFIAPVPPGLELDHLCRNRACVNPLHLRACTHRENVLAPGAISIAARNWSSMHCTRGHPYTERRDYRGWRWCPTCRAEHKRKYAERCATGAVKVRSDVCRRGHDMTGSNARPMQSGGWKCRACEQQQGRERMQRLREKKLGQQQSKTAR